MSRLDEIAEEINSISKENKLLKDKNELLMRQLIILVLNNPEGEFKNMDYPNFDITKVHVGIGMDTCRINVKDDNGELIPIKSFDELLAFLGEVGD